MSECESHGHDLARIPWRRIRTRRNPAVHRDGIVRPMRFASLHHHSTFSYLDGYQMPEAHVRRATEIGMGSLAMTEHGNVSSHVKLEIAAQAAGVKPIYGVELYTGGVTEDTRTQIKNHLTVLAADDEGYRNLLRLVSATYAEGFYHSPTADDAMLQRFARGLVILSGCAGSELFTAAVGGKHVPESKAGPRRALAVARRFRRRFGDRYFIEVQAFPELDKTRRANPILAAIARKLGIGLVATMDCHYTALVESEMQQVLHNVRAAGRKTLEELAQDWGYDVPLCPPPNDAAIVRRLIGTGLTKTQALEAVANTALIAGGCNVTLPRLPMLRYPADDGVSSEDRFDEWIADGWSFRGIDAHSDNTVRLYRERIEREIEVIRGKDFADYFLVVSDAVRWAKDNGVSVGPARGSAAASLVCYLLRITEVDPMRFPHLLFERFIDTTRDDLPDIDLDFDSDRRHEVRAYLVDKYGAECVSNIGTFTTYKGKMALDDTARAFRIPREDVEQVKAVLVDAGKNATATIADAAERFEQARTVLEKHPDLGLAMDLEGNVKSFGVHAAGLVVSNGPITDVAAVYERKVAGHTVDVISLDKYDAERQGMVKMDFLGLSTMALVTAAIETLSMDIQDLYDLPLDDAETLEGFRQNDVAGVFQFDGRTARGLNAQVQPDSFLEVCDVNALSRPGPLANGAAARYIAIKHGRARVEPVHPAFDAITEQTYGQLIYQEQTIRVVRDIGGYSWERAGVVRRIISKSLGREEFDRQRGEFLAGAARTVPDMDPELAEGIWERVITAGAYAFNYAHAVSYGMLAWWTMYLKRHHPEAFYAAALAKLPDTRSREILRDAHLHGLAIRPPEPWSDETWTPGDGEIMAGLTQIHGIGERMARTMIDHRERVGGITQWDSYLAVRGFGAKTLEKIEAFCAAEDPFEVVLLERRIEALRRTCEGGPLPMPSHTAIDIEAIPEDREEPVVWAGIVLERIPRDVFEQAAKRGAPLERSEVRDPHLSEYMVLRAADADGEVKIHLPRWYWPTVRDEINGLRIGVDLVLVRGMRPTWGGGQYIAARSIWVVDPDDLLV